MDKLFVNFLPPWVETNIQPAFYDKESGSVLQQTARMYAKVNCLVRMFNKLSKETKETVEDYIARFVELKDFVDTYFENLDVQEEINNKLDQMVESGEFYTILANYLIIAGGNAKALGCKGDGVTDDTAALNAAITTCVAAGTNKLVLPEGEFVISGVINIPSNFELVGMEGSVLKYVGDGTSGNIIEIRGTDAATPVENVTVKNIYIDGTNQTYKGGHTMSTPTVTSTDPCYKGLTCILVMYGKNVNIESCYFKDIYGDGIKLNYSSSCIVKDNLLYDVSSGNITFNGQTGYDNHGDAIVAFSSFNIKFLSNSVINTRTYQTGLSGAIGKPCGRSGLEFEYAINQDYEDDNPDDTTHNAPDYSLIPTVTRNDRQVRKSYGLIMSNNFVYGYTKAIHLESDVKALITNNYLLFSHIGIMASIDSGTVFSNNYINPLGVGKAPQSGYDAYYSGIAISSYAGADERRYGIIVSGNVFEGEGKGVILGCSNITITNNMFKTEYGIYTTETGLSNLIITNNTFNDNGVTTVHNPIYLYRVSAVIIKGNQLYSTSGNTMSISGNNLQIENNIFENVRIYHDYGGSNIAIKDNIFKGESPAGPTVYIATPTSATIEGNSFYADSASYDNLVIVQVYGQCNKSLFANNKFYLAESRGNKIVVYFDGNLRDSKLIGNYAYGTTSVSRLFVFYVANRNIIKNNVLENDRGYVAYCTGNFRDWHVVEHNQGKIYSTGFYPNQSLDKLAGDYYNTSDKYYKYNITPSSTTIGWICTASGYYVTTSWSSSEISTGSIIKNQYNNVYRCITKGSGASTVEPTHTTAENVTESDGYEWEYLGAVATFKELTA